MWTLPRLNEPTPLYVSLSVYRTYRLINYFSYSLTDWLIDLRTDYVTDTLIHLLAHSPTHSLIYWRTHYLTRSFTRWLTYSHTDSLNRYFIPPLSLSLSLPIPNCYLKSHPPSKSNIFIHHSIEILFSMFSSTFFTRRLEVLQFPVLIGSHPNWLTDPYNR